MPILDKNTRSFEYPVPINAVNLRSNLIELDQREGFILKNVVFLSGMSKRRGNAKLIAAEVSTGKAISGLFRFYYATDNRKLLVASGTVIKELNGAAWDVIDATIGQSQTDGTPTHFSTWGALNKVYISNGVDRAISYDGTTALEAGTATVTIVDYTLIDAGDTVTVIVDGTTTVLTAGGTDWTAATSNDATATSLASAIDGVSGLGASATGAVVTITADLANHLQDLDTSMEAAEGTISKKFLGPPKALQFLSYQDRLLCIDATNPGELTWSKSFDDVTWETRSATGVRPDTELFGMTLHSLSDTDSGTVAAVLLAGANGMYFFQGTNLATPATTGDYTIYPLATTVGCNAPRTMTWTPVGTMYLGIDRMVYLIPFESSTPIPVGQRLFSGVPGIEGIEKLPKAQIPTACAVYHNGYYKIAFAQEGETTNTTQYWLEIEKLKKFPDETFGPWFGPMIGMSISVFAGQNGPGDSGELRTGEDTAATGSFVYDSNVVDNFGDVGTAIDVFIQTYYNPLGELALGKELHQAELELLSTSGAITMDLTDLNGDLLVDITVPSSSGGFWGDSFWGESFWTEESPIRSRVSLTPPFTCRRCSVTVKHSSAVANFVLYAIRVNATEGSSIYVGRGV